MLEHNNEVLAVHITTLKENDTRHEKAIAVLQQEISTLKEDHAGLKAVIPQIFTMLSDIKAKVDKTEEKSTDKWSGFFEKAFWVVGTGIVTFVIYYLVAHVGK